MVSALECDANVLSIHSSDELIMVHYVVRHYALTHCVRCHGYQNLAYVGQRDLWMKAIKGNVYLLLLLCSTPPLLILEGSPNRPTGYADNMSIHVSSKGITLAGSVHRPRAVMGCTARCM